MKIKFNQQKVKAYEKKNGTRWRNPEDIYSDKIISTGEITVNGLIYPIELFDLKE